MEGLFQDLSHQIGSVHAPCAFHEGTIDLILLRVRVQVHLLVRVFAVVMRWNVARDNHHRDTVQRRIRDPGGAVGQPRRQV